MPGKADRAGGYYAASVFGNLWRRPPQGSFRINDQKAIETSWADSVRTGGVFASPPAWALAAIKALPDNGALFFRVFDFQGNGHDATFNLGIVSAVREQVAEACRWNDSAAAPRSSPAPAKAVPISPPRTPAAKPN